MTLIRTENWVNSKLIWTQSLLGSIALWAPIWPPMALNFDWSNDFVISDILTPYTEPPKWQACTFFASFETDFTFWVVNELYTTVRPAPFNGTRFWIHDFWRQFQIVMYDWLGWILNVRWSYVFPPVWRHTYAVTYDWSGTAAGVKMYHNWLIDFQTNASDTLVWDIVNWAGRVTLWFLPGFVWPDFNWRMRRLSLVDYVKSPAEILADHNNEIQSPWTGTYLFAADFNRTSGLTFPSSDPAALNMIISGQPVGDRVPR